MVEICNLKQVTEEEEVVTCSKYKMAEFGTTLFMLRLAHHTVNALKKSRKYMIWDLGCHWLTVFLATLAIPWPPVSSTGRGLWLPQI